MTAEIPYDEATKKWNNDKEYLMEKRKNHALNRFGLLLLKAERELGVSREEIAARTGISSERIAKFEGADEAPDLLEVQLIAMAIGYNAKVVFTLDESN